MAKGIEKSSLPYYVQFLNESASECLYLDLEYIAESKGKLRWVFKTPGGKDSQYMLLLYSGIPGEAEGRKIVYEDVRLYEGIFNA